MRIIPAIDIINGKCVRLTRGDYNTKKVYDSSPLDVAKAYADVGLEYLHLVDLDGAKNQHIVNTKVLEDICSKTNLIVDFGGGVKSDDDIAAAFACGASQITAGSIAVKSPEKVEDWLEKYGPDRIILGADVKKERVAINGWLEDTDLDIYSFISQYRKKGVKNIISTDIATDGMLQGPSIELYKKMLDQFKGINLIASGGVTTIDDLKRLAEIGVEGAIIGKAIYENKISLNELRNYVS